MIPKRLISLLYGRHQEFRTEIEREADAVLDRWFVEYTDYVEIEW